MIRVMNVISDTNIGGAGRCLLNYLKYCDRDRFSVSVALPQGSLLTPEIRKLGVPVRELAIEGDRSLDRKAIGVIREAIREEDPQIVHTHGALSARIAGRREGKKVVYTRHSAFPVKSYIRHGPGRLLNKWLNEHYADRIIAVSPACYENLTDGGISPERIDTMMNGVEPVPRSSKEDCAALRETLGLPEGVFTAGILARLEPYKGHMHILEAAALLKEQGRDFRILFAGVGSYEQALRERCGELGLEEEIRFLGFVSEVGPLLSILDVQLNASYGTETSSLSVLEGFSMSLPAIVSTYGGNPCLVEDGVNGFLFENRNSAALAEKLARVMDEPALLSRMGDEARLRYENEFTGEIFARNIEKVYDRVMEVR